MSTPETSASPLPVLQQPLDEIVREMGFTKLKPKQLEAIVAVVSGNDTFLSLPTGYGKSVVVVSLPLILTCSGKLWPIVAAAARALELQNKLELLASFVVLRMRTLLCL